MRFDRRVFHFVLMPGLLLLLTAAIVYPFLPGEYDALAVTLSSMTQALGVIGLLPALIGVLWLVYEWRKQARVGRNLPHKMKAYRFALGALVASAIPMIVVTAAAFFSVGLSLMLPTLAVCLGVIAKLLPKLKLLKNSETTNFNPAPVWLTLIPIVLSLAQFCLARPLTEFSRNRAMANSAELIQAIERHRERFGSYPESLLALHPDYKTSVVGIEQYHYAPRGEAYNLSFEQPRFVFDDLGIREIVVYNKLDQHLMLSHAAWILEWSPDRLPSSQGWHSAETARPHWMSFSFD